MKDSDSFNLLGEQLAGRALGLIGAFLLVSYVVTSHWDYADKLEAEAKAKAERAEMIQAHMEALGKLSHPCAATIRDGMTSVTMSPERCVRVAEGK